MHAVQRHALLIAVAVLALGGVFWSLRRPRTDEQALRAVGTLEVTAVEWQHAGDRVRVSGRVVNRDGRPARSVVLTVRVTDRSGAVVGVNPLVNVLNVPTGSGATFETWVSVPRGTEPAHVTVEPTVASWME